MRLNPFPSRRSGRGYDEDDGEEEVVVTKVRRKVQPDSHKQPVSRRSKKEGRAFVADSDDEDEHDRFRHRGGDPSKQQRRDSRNLSYAGGSATARSHTRGRSASPSPSRNRMRSLTPDTPRKRLNHEKELHENNEASSPEVNALGSSSPSRHRAGMGGASKASASKRSKASESRTYSLSSSDDDSEDANERPARLRPPSRRPSMSNGSRVKGDNTSRRGRSQGREPEEDVESRTRAKVVPGSSLRRTRSRDPAAPDHSPEPLTRRDHHKHDITRKSRSLSRSRQRPDQPVRHRSRRASSPPPQKTSKPLVRAARHSWGNFFRGLTKNTQYDNDNEDGDMVDVRDASDEEEYEDRGVTAKSPRHRHPPNPADEFQAQAKPPVRVKESRDEHYVDPGRRQPYANLYAFDNFPAIDRVPTAIGYHSDDSIEEFQERRSTHSRNRRKDGDGEAFGTDDKVDDDNMSFTSRYSVDVKSVRGSKLKKVNKDRADFMRYRDGEPNAGIDNFSHDENDDKYAQYLAGADPNILLSDSSDSCPPTWHPALDADDSDWYDEDEETDAKMMQQRNGNKKYQVSGVASAEERQQRRKSKKNKKELTADKAGNNGGPPRDDSNAKDNQVAALGDNRRGDAIVTNRSDGSDRLAPKSSRAIVVGSSHPHEKPLGGKEEGSDDDDEMQSAPRKHRPGKPQRRNPKSRQKNYDDGDDGDDDSGVTDYSYDDTTRRSSRKQSEHIEKESVGMSRKARGGKIANFMRPSLGKGKQGTKHKGFKDKLKNFRRGGRGAATDYGSSSDDSTDMHLAPTRSTLSDTVSRRVDPSLAKLEQDEMKESTFNHNMIRNNRKEITELDELDEVSVNNDPNNMMSCGFFPFGLTGLTSTPCFFNNAASSGLEEIPLDSVQIQRLRDSKYDLENKPKVEVILQDLQDPLAEKYDKLEKKLRKEQRQIKQKKEAEDEIEKREREELLRLKREMRETEQRKLHQIQAKDLALQEAPDLTRGKNQSFVMDISDWVLNLDGDGRTPRRTPATPRDKDTPRTNGRDGPSSPLAKLPFSTIEVPTASMDSTENRSKKASGTHQGWRRRQKKGASSDSPSMAGTMQSGSANHSNGNRLIIQKKKTKTKKKGWFRRG